VSEPAAIRLCAQNYHRGSTDGTGRGDGLRDKWRCFCELDRYESYSRSRRPTANGSFKVLLAAHSLFTIQVFIRVLEAFPFGIPFPTQKKGFVIKVSVSFSDRVIIVTTSYPSASVPASLIDGVATVSSVIARKEECKSDGAAEGGDTRGDAVVEETKYEEEEGGGACKQ
jgi:hypothetical protein